MKLGARAVARVNTPPLFQPGKHLPVGLSPQALRGLLRIPREPEPLEVTLEGVRVLRPAPVGVQVLDAQHEPSAAASDGQPREHGRKDVSQMHSAAGAWRKAPDLLHISSPFRAILTHINRVCNRRYSAKCPCAQKRMGKKLYSANCCRYSS